MYKDFHKNMLKFSEKVCVIDDNNKIKYKDMLLFIDKISNRLKKLKLSKNHKVLIISSNTWELSVIILVCIKLKIIFSVIQYNNKQKYEIIKNLKPNIIITEKYDYKLEFDNITIKDLFDFTKELKNTQINIQKSSGLIDIFSILYTSSSTSVNPKGVIISYDNVKSSLEGILKTIPYTSSDNILNYLPLSFDYGLYQLLFSFKLGSTLILKNYPLFPANIVEDLNKYKITIFPGMKSLFYFIKLIKCKEFKLLRIITNTGESISEQEIKKLMLIAPNSNIYLMYGLTECKRVSIFNLNKNMDKINSVGKVLNHMEAYVLKEDGELAHNFEIGELYIKGPNVCKGYYNNEQDTRKVFIGNNTLKTGDLVYFDNDDFLYFIGRKDGLFKKNGYLISSNYIENKFADIIYKKYNINIYPIILNYKEKFILAIYNNKIYIQKKEIMNIYKETFNSWEYPDKIVFLDKNVPFSMNGKVNRKLIKEEIIFTIEREQL